MKRTTLALGACLALSGALSGCDLWFGNQQCDVVPVPPSEPGLLDPFTGQCEPTGGGGGSCDDVGGPVADEPVFVDMAACISECTGLSESDCMATPLCRAAYLGDCAEGLDCDNTTYTYYECWAIAPSGPAPAGGCTALDAYECSRHEDCVALHYQGAPCESGGNCAPTMGSFETCAPEPEPPQPQVTCYGTELCESLPPECPAGTVPGILGDCWSGTCVEYEACDPPIDPGTCDGELLCDSLPPECPPDSTPGILDGCWTGFCIPSDECFVAP